MDFFRKDIGPVTRFLAKKEPFEHFGHHASLADKILLVVIMVLAFFPVLSARAANLSVDGSQKFQTIDGFGVNANSLSWKNGELRPAIDLLADEMGSNLWRVVFDMEDWEAVNDNSDPNVFNWDYYNRVYSNSKFQNLWGTIGYLNEKGISSNIILSLMGRVPSWMGGGNGSRIDAAAEDEWVEMVASLVYYARNTMQLSFSMFDPMNEPDWNGYEGPQVDQYQYVRLLNKLSQKLDSLGLSDIRFVGPNTAIISIGINNYMAEMMKDSVVMSKVDHFGFHNYEGTTSYAADAIKSSAYPDRNFYMTEITTFPNILDVMDQGTSGICIWDGYDSVYNHSILMGGVSTPPNDAANGPAPLAYNSATGIYTPRKVFYLYEQLFKYVPRGSVRISSVQNSGNGDLLAFYHEQSGRVAIVGRNTGSSSISYAGRLANLPQINTLQFYRTSEIDPAINFLKGNDIPVNNGAFIFSAPPNSTYTLTGMVVSVDSTPPTVSMTSPPNGAIIDNTVTISAIASDNVSVAGVRFLLNGASLGGEITALPYNFSWDTTTVVNGNYTLSAVARDLSGNTDNAAPVIVNVANVDTTPPTVSITSPQQNATVSGTILVKAAAGDTNGITGLQFLIDGAKYGLEITTLPYSMSLNTTAVADGVHTVAAQARDSSGNVSTSPVVSFSVLNNPGGVFPINLVQKVSNITISAQNLAATLPMLVTAGNLIVVSVSGWPSLPASTAVTDSLGNSYAIAGSILASQGAFSAIYYAKNVNGGGDTVTVSTVNANCQISMEVAEFSGIDKVSPLDKATGSVGSGNTPSSGIMTPGIAGELVIGSGTHNGNTMTTPGTGFSIVAIPTEDSATHQPLAMEYQILSGIQPVTASFNLTVGYPWAQNGALFKPAVQRAPDTILPTVSISSPQNNATVSATISVSVIASDNVGVTRVEFYLDSILQTTDMASSYDWSLNTTQVTNGSHVIKATAYDAAGNSATASVTVLVNNFIDTIAPTVAVTAPANNATVSGTVAVSANASDNVVVSRIEFYVNGLLQTTDTTIPYSFNWNSAAVANGPYTLTAKAYDAAGNSGTSTAVAVTVSNQAASIVLVQRAFSTTSSAQNLASILSLPVTAGNLIVVSVSGWPNLPATPAVTDTLGNGYSIAGTVLSSQGAYSAIYYAKNVRGGTNTVTFRTVRSGGQISMVVAEFSGVDTVAPLDRTASATGSGNAPSSGNMTPSQAGDLVIGSGTHNGNTVTTAGSGFAMIAIPTEDSNTHQPLAMEYQVLPGIQPTAAAFRLNTGYGWTQNGALFKRK